MEDIFYLGLKALIFDTNGNILLLRINPAKLKSVTAPYWDIPGGRINRGETFHEALYREIFEETGITSNYINNCEHFLSVASPLIRIFYQDSDAGLVISTYSCQLKTIPSIIISDEHVAFKWFTPPEAATVLTQRFPLELTEKIRTLNSSNITHKTRVANSQI